MRVKADLVLLLISVIWGSAFVAQRVAGQVGSVYLFNGARYLLAAMVVLPFAGGRRFLQASRPQMSWMLVAGFLLYLASGLQQAGMVYTTAGNAGFITSLYVVLIPVLLFVFWREKQHWISIVSVVLAGAGAFFLSTAGDFVVQQGDTLEILGAVFWAFHVIVLGKFASQFEPMTFSVGQLAVCGLLNLGTGGLTESGIDLNWSMVIAILYTAAFSLGLCYTLQVWAQKHTPPADAALILSLESVFAVLSGWWILGERLVAIQFLGCTLIFIAVVFSQFKGSASGAIGSDHLIEGR